MTGWRSIRKITETMIMMLFIIPAMTVTVHALEPDLDPDPQPEMNLFMGAIGQDEWVYDEEDRSYTLSCGGGSAVLSLLDEDNPVLTLTNVTYSGDGYEIDDDHSALIYYKGYKPLTVMIEGENTLELDSQHAYEYGIYSENVGLIFDGEGSYSSAVCVNSNSDRGWGAYVEGDVSVKGGTLDMTVNLAEDSIVQNNMSYALECTGAFNMIGGSLTAQNKGLGYGLYGSSNITVSGGELSASGSNYGIYTDKKVIVSDGTLSAVCDGPAPKPSYGIECSGFCVSGGSVTAVAHYGNGNDYPKSYGIYSEGQVNISGGKVKAQGGSITGSDWYPESYGIFARQSGPAEEGLSAAVVISGGTVEAIGGDVTVSDATGFYSALTVGIRGEATPNSNEEVTDYYAVVISSGTVTAKGGRSLATVGTSQGNKAYAMSCGIDSYVADSTHNGYAVCIKKDAKVTATGGDADGPHKLSQGIRIEPLSAALYDASYSFETGNYGEFSNGRYYGLIIDEDLDSLEASGKTKAVFGEVFNAVSGKGWSDVEGTQGEEAIPVSDNGKELGYLKTLFPATGQINYKKAVIPAGKDLTYTGKEQTGVAAGEGYTLSGMVSAVNAGSYEAVATLNDGYIWSDGTKKEKTIKWTIKKATVKVTPPSGKNLTYNGKEQTGVAAGEGYILSGTKSAKNAGDYTAKATLNTDANHIYKWTDGTTEEKTISWKIKKAEKSVNIPKAEKNLVYNKKTQTGVKSGSNYTLSGTVKAKNAGKYTATAKLKTDQNYTYKWSDGKTGSKKINWSIGKAVNTLSVKGKTRDVKYSKLKDKDQKVDVSKVINLKNKGQGDKTYTKSSGNKKITIGKKTGKVTVKKGLKKGTYEIKVNVKAAGNDNYKASAAKSVKFTIRVR